MTAALRLGLIRTADNVTARKLIQSKAVIITAAGSLQVFPLQTHISDIEDNLVPEITLEIDIPLLDIGCGLARNGRIERLTEG